MDTRHKIQIATAAYTVVSFARRCVGKGDRSVVTRGGVRWDLDLHEGIDFSIFLLGGFEPRMLRLYSKLLGRQAGEIVFDIGANVGAHTLPLARLVAPGGGRVYAFEPTDYAFRKLVNNVSLNPSIEGIEVHQAILAAADDVAVERDFYASWPLGEEAGLHEDHRGQLKPTLGARVYSLDSFVREHGITRIDFIKLDVDGHEPAVLAGAWSSLHRFHPTIAMEWLPPRSSSRSDELILALKRVLGMGYRLCDGSSGRPVPGGLEELDQRTPPRGSMNILLRPPGTVPTDRNWTAE